MWLLILLSLQIFGVFGGTIESFGSAGEHLALLPMQEDQAESSIVPEEIPSFLDLAISRLQIQVDELIDLIWDSMNNKREFLILQEKGLSSNILGLFRDGLQSDVFALEQNLDEINFERSLKTLAVPQNQATEWYQTQAEFSKILGKLSYFNYCFVYIM